MLSFEDLVTSLRECVITEDQAPETVSRTLRLFTDKLSESSSTNVKRCKERCLEEAAQLLRQVPGTQLAVLDVDYLLLLVKLLISLQLQMANISTACRKVDQVLSFEGLQRACMFLEDSTVGREVWRESYLPLLNKVSELFPVVLQQESLRDGPLCYIAVKCCNRDTRLLAGTAVAMLINTASDSTAGGAAAWSLLQVSDLEPWMLSVGALRVQCTPTVKDGVARLAVSRGLLTCCQPHILLSSGMDVTEVEGVSEFVRSAFCLLLDVYEMDCEHFGETKKSLYFTLLERIMKLPWEAKAKYHRLCALLPYLGTDMVLDQYTEIPTHLLKCLSTNHLSPCGSELYKCLIQQQRRELCHGSDSNSELNLAGQWARRWQPVLHKALTSDVTLLQNNSSAHLLPCTFQVFPSAWNHLLASLDPFTPGHLHAWACIMSSYRAVTGSSPWSLQGSSALETLQLALGSADDKPKDQRHSKHRGDGNNEVFIPQNLNCESSPFRQHLQAGVKRFLVRIRDGCLAHVRGQKGKKKGDTTHSEKAQSILEQGIVLETCTDTWSPDRKKGQPPDPGALSWIIIEIFPTQFSR
ncbi:hypothetical protein INR49_006243 [Caranx melampygus]|nr:hypothetical protein INR49_006243 [Caranx melampygus]